MDDIENESQDAVVCRLNDVDEGLRKTTSASAGDRPIDIPNQLLITALCLNRLPITPLAALVLEYYTGVIKDDVLDRMRSIHAALIYGDQSSTDHDQTEPLVQEFCRLLELLQ